MTIEKVRLSKVMAMRGLCSRREADEWIESGFVYYRGGWCEDIDVFKASRRVYLDAFIDGSLKVFAGR